LLPGNIKIFQSTGLAFMITFATHSTPYQGCW